MTRRVFFSFNYNKDVWRVNQIRSMPNIIGSAAAGFHDASLWEEAKKKGDAAIKKLIDKGLENTSVTVVCVTYGIAVRKYINYEIDQSLKRRNGLLGIQIDHLKDHAGNITSPGSIPSQIEKAGFKAYKYVNKERLAVWIEQAAKLAGK
ncbi:MAG: TIR domain-containing protein [Candidatus Omnitrophica bacterium]|nr:TIR domain-containing protein [Candidatus Omnitrophota bacterium]